MNRSLFIILFLSNLAFGQSFAPEPGQAGSTAIHKDSSVIIDWASNVSVQRGYLNIQNQSLGLATYGTEMDAVGPADGISVISLGDSGVAEITFNTPIVNGFGPDFAVFENGFIDHYMELAFVEVSSNGVDYIRFDATSEIPTAVQLSNFDTAHCAYVNNLAGKYRAEYGTPFDLEELVGQPNLDVNNIQHVRLVDVIGSIDSLVGSMDYLGNMINDPYPTEWESGGFDLDAVGVIHNANSGVNDLKDALVVYPNPTDGILHLRGDNIAVVELFSAEGKLLVYGEGVNSVLDLSKLPEGIYYLKIYLRNDRVICHKQIIAR